MLKKLFVYDFKAIGKTMWLFTAIAIILSGAGSLAVFGTDALRIGINDATDPGMKPVLGVVLSACVAVMVACIFGVVAYCVLGIIMIMVRYYTNLFTDEGYLTFTLPVKKSTILNAKLLSGVAWFSIVLAVTFFCFCLFSFSSTVVWGVDASDMYYYGGEPNIIYNYLEIAVRFLEFNSLIITVFFFVACIYLCVTLASVIAKRARVILGIGLFFAVNSTLGTIITIGDAIISYNSYSEVFFGYEYYVDTIGQDLLFIVVYGAVALVAYFLNRYLLKNKLNLL